MADGTCSIAGCERKRQARGWCFMHYGRWKRNGDPLCSIRLPSGAPIRARILQHVRVDESGCWRWQGAKKSNGYGHICVAGSMRHVHRVSYEAWVGPIPEGLEIDHLCRVRDCCNPQHLEPVTSRENTLRGTSWTADNARKTHCPQRHPYNEANTWRHPSTGYRMCRTCNRDRARARWARAKGAGDDSSDRPGTREASR